MLIIGLIAAAILYGVLYWIYVAAQPQLTGIASILQLVNSMVTLPEPSVFFILRWLLIITALYVMVDFLLHPARRKLRERRQRKRDEEHDRTAFRGVKPITPPPASDDTLPHF
jgi:hypothetical protein